ncbi:COG1470 family protein [Streptomyces sp. NPDC003691]
MAARLRTAVPALLGPVLLPGLLAVPVYAAPAPGGPGWTLAPAPGTGRPHIYAEGAPGAVLEDRLTVTNPGATALTVRLEPAPADGPGAWLAFAARTVTVPPRTRADVPFSVTVPPGTPPGERSAEISAAAVPAGRRTAVRLHLRVTGPAVAALSVEDVSAEGAAVRYTLVNRGNTVLRPRVELTADGLLGTAHRRTVRTGPAELLPGRRVTRTETWGERPLLDTVDIRVTATAGPGTRAAAGTSAAYVSRPLAAAALTGAAVLLFALVRRLERRRRGRAAPGGVSGGGPQPSGTGQLVTRPGP